MLWDLCYALSIFSWQDLVEVCLLAALISRFCAWLAYDKQTNLLIYSYAYGFIGITSYYLGMATLTIICVVSIPLFVALLFIIHQKTLQKNFVALKKITPASPVRESSWLASVARTCLRSMNQQKSVAVVIQQVDDISPFLTNSIAVQAPIHNALLDLLVTDTIKTGSMFWATTEGTLVGINTTWNFGVDAVGHDANFQKLATWKQHALMLSAKTDAVFVYVDAATRQTTIIAQAKAYDNMRFEQALTLLCSLLQLSPISLEQGEYSYAPYHTQRNATQQLS